MSESAVRLTIKVNGVEQFADVLARALVLMRGVERHAADIPDEVVGQARDFRAVLTEHGFPMRRWDREDAGGDE